MLYPSDDVQVPDQITRHRARPPLRFSRFGRNGSLVIALGALPAIVLYGNGLVLDQALLYQLCGLTGSIAILVGVRIHRPPHAAAWYLLAAGNLMFVAGDMVYAANADASGVTGFPSQADVVYLAAYPILAAGLVAISGQARRSIGNLIDACIVAISAGLVGWAFLMEPYASDTSLTVAEKVFSIGYPVGDLILFATLSWFIFSKSQRNASLTWLFVSAASLLISDVVYGIQVIEGTYVLGWTDAGFIISYLTFGAAALHPSIRTLGQGKNATSSSTSRGRLAFLGLATIVGPALLAVSATRERGINLWVLAIGTLALFLLTFLRMAGLMRAVERNADRLIVLESARSHLMEAVQGAGEKERASLALDLHDGPIQHLTALSYELELASMSLREGNIAAVNEALTVLEGGLCTEIDSLRLLMTGLRPPALDERGLEQALCDLVAAFESRTEIECVLDVQLASRLPSEIETILFRIAQEALTNVAKHSGARRSSVSCISDDVVTMEIADDGVGFDPLTTDMSGRNGHLGLASIKQRIGHSEGTTSIVSRPGEGTRITVAVVTEEVKDAEIARTAG